MWHKTLKVSVLFAYLIVRCAGFISISEAQSEDVVFSPYPGSTPLLDHVTSNSPGQDGKGFHWSTWTDSSGASHYNDPGLDIISQEKLIYSPIESCPSNGGRVVIVDDIVGQGGHGLVLEQDNIRIEMWHLAGYSDLLLNAISDGTCINPHDLLGYEGESTTVYPNGVLVFSTFSEQGWGIPAHTHLGVAKTSPWNNGCAEMQVGAWYFTNPVCVVQTWDTNTVAVVNTTQTDVSFDVITMLQNLFFQPKPREIVPSESQALKKAGILPKWFFIAAVFVAAGILVMKRR